MQQELDRAQENRLVYMEQIDRMSQELAEKDKQIRQEQMGKLDLQRELAKLNENLIQV